MKSHMLKKHPLYRRWCNIKSRCYNPNTHNYANYGGKGIVLCDLWREDFKSFYDWCVENGYRIDLTLDRIDSNGNYEPSNCRWTTIEVQARNRGKHRRGKCKFIGVYPMNWGNCNRFASSIHANGRRIYLGIFHTPEDAARTRDQYILDNNLVGYNLNFA